MLMIIRHITFNTHHNKINYRQLKFSLKQEKQIRCAPIDVVRPIYHIYMIYQLSEFKGAEGKAGI